MNRSTFIKSLLLSIPVIGVMIKAKNKPKLRWSEEPMISRTVWRNQGNSEGPFMFTSSSSLLPVGHTGDVMYYGTGKWEKPRKKPGRLSGLERR